MTRDVTALLNDAHIINERNTRTQQQLDADDVPDIVWRQQYKKVQAELRAAAKAAGFANIRHALNAATQLVRDIEHSMP